jgi:hypothetical protein
MVEYFMVRCVYVDGESVGRLLRLLGNPRAAFLFGAEPVAVDLFQNTVFTFQ